MKPVLAESSQTFDDPLQLLTGCVGLVIRYRNCYHQFGKESLTGRCEVDENYANPTRRVSCIEVGGGHELTPSCKLLVLMTSGLIASRVESAAGFHVVTPRPLRMMR